MWLLPVIVLHNGLAHVVTIAQTSASSCLHTTHYMHLVRNQAWVCVSETDGQSLKGDRRSRWVQNVNEVLFESLPPPSDDICVGLTACFQFMARSVVWLKRVCGIRVVSRDHTGVELDVKLVARAGIQVVREQGGESKCWYLTKNCSCWMQK